MTDNFKHCQRIAETVEAYADGRVYRCHECEHEFTDDPNREGPLVCPECGYVDAEGDNEQLDLYDYMTDVLDIEYTVASDRKTVRGVRLMVAFGGPTIYIDTMKRAVTLHWWTENAQCSLSHNVCDRINEWAQELWDLG